MTKSEKFQLVENYIIENQNAHYRLAFSYVKNKESALDIIQDSIMKALKSIDSLEQTGYLKTWFYRILINTSIDFIHKNKRIVVVEDEVLDFHLPSSEMEVPDIDLYEAIDNLAPEQKTLIILRFFEDIKIEDIAKMLGVNQNTIKTRLYATLRKLRTNMEEKVKV
ncbi:sigma-70 family RNA polymerase sigma factor [Psychrobacillus sp. INOP01]|uniref:sigma-70 family RNA polymerase sigma factor n=1 Tax=Psychrobacillus sp. INOP01 TaxID=2829187 RepID=UPI001BA52537|nr:sigma-70 family RNA polymerase sigma factor [Psychrobacillus sp. INOP01]QUG43276.1 sigma-70 family RNA polymerase sigma factor [Psychrobacillus sp. INOP01]